VPQLGADELPWLGRESPVKGFKLKTCTQSTPELALKSRRTHNPLKLLTDCICC